MEGELDKERFSPLQLARNSLRVARWTSQGQGCTPVYGKHAYWAVCGFGVYILTERKKSPVITVGASHRLPNPMSWVGCQKEQTDPQGYIPPYFEEGSFSPPTYRWMQCAPWWHDCIDTHRIKQDQGRSVVKGCDKWEDKVRSMTKQALTSTER